jgi:iron complex transport system ATP-binding protein
VLKQISGELKPGKIIALLGPNGAGKSSLIQAMARLLECEGDIAIEGQALSSFSIEQLAQRLAYLPQHSQLQFPLSVEEVLSLATLPFSLTRLQQRQQVKELIKEWNIEALAKKDFRQLSGGEQQRCQIARTYLQLNNMLRQKTATDAGVKAGIWLLDEPASSLDLEHQQQLNHACRKAATEGHSVVIVLHDLNQAYALADEVWLLNQGEMIVQGNKDQVLTAEVISQVFKVNARRIEESGASYFLFS